GYLGHDERPTYLKPPSKDKNSPMKREADEGGASIDPSISPDIVITHRLIIENSIESRIIQLQEKKKALFQSTVGKDMAAMDKLSEEDLRFLFVL
ncbi:hypothetical protein SeMB42_g06318, partial [Synchytrium endobioticum]